MVIHYLTEQTLPLVLPDLIEISHAAYSSVGLKPWMVEDFVENQCNLSFLAVEDERPVGVLLASESFSRLKGNSHTQPRDQLIRIEKFAVSPPYQKHGIGQKLYRHFVREVEKLYRGHIFFKVSVPIEKPRDFWRGRGFIFDGTSNSDGGLWVLV